MALHEPDWHAARQAARDAAPRHLAEERLGLAEADRRVLAADAVACSDLPAFDTSAMDGWAVAGLGPWTLVGAVLAGGAPTLALEPGQACLIATGAAVPAGATAVVRREVGEVAGDRLAAPDPQPGADLRPRGEECRVGDVLAPAGSAVNPAVIGSLAAAGLDQVRVTRAPRVAILLFGDELVHSGIAGPGRVRDALGPQLPGWLTRLGAHVVSQDTVADTLDDHVAAIRAARATCDVVLTTGGTAAGPVDHLHAAVEALGGELVVDSVAVRPGHPMALAQFASEAGTYSGGDAARQADGHVRWLVALPGNPMSAVVALLTLGAPLFDALLARPPAPLTRVTLGADAAAPAREHRLLACTLAGHEAHPVAHLGSAMLRGLAHADGFAVLPPGGGARGDHVEWLPLPA